MRTHPWLIPATAGLITVVTALAVPNRAHADVHLSRAESESVRRVAEKANPDVYGAAADDRAADAMYAVGEAFDAGLGVRSDAHQAFDWYMRAAALGHAEAMNRLGVLYAEGRGVSRDYSAALGWYRRAAAYGSSSALSNLATMYFYGFGVPQSYPKAAQLLQIAVRGGAADAQNKLGALYDDGLGVVKDQKRALELFRQAALQGYPPAMVNLGRMYIEAIAVARDVVRGYALIRAAVDAGIPASLQELALRELGTAAGRLNAEQLARAQALASSSLCGIDQRAVGESAGIRRQDCPVDLAGPHDVQHLESLREQVVADDATMATPP